MRRSIITVATLMGLFALASPAPAGQTFESLVTIDFKAGHFLGSVSSDEPACVEDRKVVLLRKRTVHGKHKKVDTDAANATGQWFIEANPKPQIYFAEVRRKEIIGGVCGKDRSPTLDFRPG